MTHGCTVYTERADMAAVLCGTSHVSAVSTSLQWIVKNALYIFKKKPTTRVELHMPRSESARERRIALYKSDQQQQLSHITCLAAAIG